MSKGVDGVITTYVVAVLGLPQVVVETTGGSSTAYLHGHDLLGEEGTAWAWHLNDGLLFVRVPFWWYNKARMDRKQNEVNDDRDCNSRL